MLNRYRTILLLILIVQSVAFKGQTTVQLFIEDFNSFSNTFVLNSGSVGVDNGMNQWIINNEFDGLGIRPNTTSQDSTYGGTISFAPYSSYAHIYDSALVTTISNCNYDNTNASDRFRMCMGGKQGGIVHT